LLQWLTIILLQYLRGFGNFKAKIAENRVLQNDFPKAFVGNCKPHTIFTPTENLLFAGKQFFHHRQYFFVGRTPISPMLASMQTDGFKTRRGRSANGGKMRCTA